MDIGLMIAAHDGLTWDRWRHILHLAERLGFSSVFRSDHYEMAASKNSLEAYVSFVMAAMETDRIRFGPMVTPVTFRHPVDVARMAGQIDLLSNGRFVMGLGSGSVEREHHLYGLPWPSMKERFDRLEEWLQLIKALWTESPTNFDGKFYHVDGANMLPRPAAGRPPLLIGGGGEKRTLPLVAQYADEWNAINLTPDDYARKLSVLDRACATVRRDPTTIRRSLDLHALIGPTPELVERATDTLVKVFAHRYTDVDTSDRAAFRTEVKSSGILSGSTDEIIDTLGRYAEQGIDEVIFIHFFQEIDDIPEYIAAEIVPRANAL
jgi:F420-dependent oxidoreductase-like protein